MLVNVTVSEKMKYEYGNDKEIADRIESLDKKYAGSGRVLIRPSGTENRNNFV